MHMRVRTRRLSGGALLLASVLAGCGTSVPLTQTAEAPRAAAPSKSVPKAVPALPPAGSGRGGYYMDDGPGDNPPEGLLDLPDPEPQVEPYSRRGNRPYVVFGKSYTPITDERPFKQRGIGSWYGKKFHGQKTSSGELYDMYKMTAAHPTLPIPSYARVTSIATGKQIIVRVNDRGPFLGGRIIDLSYAAALKLGYLAKGSSELEVERLLPDEIARIAAGRRPSAPTNTQQAIEPSAMPTPMAAPAESAVLTASVAEVKPAVEAAASAQQHSPSGFYLQLGAYNAAGNADAARLRMMQGWPPTLPPIEVTGQGALYRLQSGPFGSRADAAIAARQLPQAGSMKPVIVQR